MRFGRSVLVVGIAAVCTLAGIVALNAQPSPHYWKPALWVVKVNAPDDSVLKVNSVTGDLILEVASNDITSVAVDETRGGSLWALATWVSMSELRQFTFDGVFLHAVPLNTLSLPLPVGLDSDDPDCLGPATPEIEEACAPHRDVVVDQGTGDVFAVVDGGLYQYTLASESVTLIEMLPSDIPLRSFRAVAFDSGHSLLYSVHGGRVRQHNLGNGTVMDLPIPAGETAKDVSVDRSSRQVWVAYSGTLRRFSSSGALELSVAIPGLRRVSADGQGNCYAATATTALRVDANGNIEWESVLFSAATAIVDLVADPNDQTVWGATTLGVKQLSTAGDEARLLGAEALGARAVSAFADIVPPQLQVAVPGSGSIRNTNTPSVTLTVQEDGSGVDPTSLTLSGMGSVPSCMWNAAYSSVTCTGTIAWADGQRTILATVQDYEGNLAAASSTFTVDTTGPVVTITSPIAGYTTQAAQTLTGSVNEAVNVARLERPGFSNVNLLPLTNLQFSKAITLVEGVNSLKVVAFDIVNNRGEATVSITLDTIPPAVPDSGKISVGVPNGSGIVTISGTAGAAEGGSTLTVCNTAGTCVSVTVNADGSFSLQLAGKPGDRYDMYVTDPATNRSGTVTAGPGPGTFVPPNAFAGAPAMNPTIASRFRSDYGFLVEGESRVQAGHRLSLFTPEVTGIVRGLVTDTAGNGIAQVQVEVVGREEYGRTFTFANGEFLMTVEGGQKLTLHFAKQGYIDAYRDATVPWRGFAQTRDLTLLAPDPVETVLTFGTAGLLQVAGSTTVADADGSRTARLVVPSATTAKLVAVNGTETALSSLSLRMRELTVGAQGEQRMVADLPPSSIYTYMVSFDVAEVSDPRTEVVFSRAVPFHVDNFMAYPVGSRIPSGAWDPRTATWKPGRDSKVIRILSITDGKADLDVDGTGVGANAARLAFFEVADEERAHLAATYPVGKELTRALLPHLSVWDLNVGGRCDACVKPNGKPPIPMEIPPPDSECSAGSIVECPSQTLGETVPLTGTGATLEYRSDRVKARRSAYTISIPVTGSTVPEPVLSTRVEVEIAGRHFRQTFDDAPNRTWEFVWDSKDLFGRHVQGKQRAKVRVAWIFALTPIAGAGPENHASFNQPPVEGASVLPARSGFATADVVLEFETRVGGFDAKELGMGGFTLSPHHVLDPTGSNVYFGDGGEIENADLVRQMSRFAGGGTNAGDGVPAAEAILAVHGVEIAANGTVFFSEFQGPSIRYIQNGSVNTLAGDRFLSGFADGIGAAARFDRAEGIALGPDGALYVADYNNNRVRRVTTGGVVTTIAGTGTAGFSGDYGPALQANLDRPFDVAVGSDGAVFVAVEGARIRRIGPDGIITTYAGTGAGGNTGDGGSAVSAQIAPTSVAIDAGGTLYLTSSELTSKFVRKITPAGIITTIAGTTNTGVRCENCPATTSWTNAHHVTVGPDGSLYLSEGKNTLLDPAPANRVRRISPTGIITTVVGHSDAPDAYDPQTEGGAPPKSQMGRNAGLAVSSDNRLFVGDSEQGLIRVVVPGIPATATDDILVPRGRTVAVFDSAGRHLRTRDAITGATLLTFGYQSSGLLATVTDADGNVLQVERNAAGTPTGILAPGGQRTTLSVDANGYLNVAQSTGGSSWDFDFRVDGKGLLDKLTDPRGGLHEYQFDADGRLSRNDDAENGFNTLTRTGSPANSTITRSSAIGRSTGYSQWFDSESEQSGVDVTYPDATTRSVEGDEINSSSTESDGTTSTSARARDPRFGMIDPLVNGSVTVPSGKTVSATRSRTVTLANPADSMSLSALTDSVTVSGRTYTAAYNAASRTWTLTSPAGRQATTTLDTRGRVSGVQLPSLAAVSVTRDANGRVSQVTHGSGMDARTVLLGYDAKQELVSITDPLSRTTSFQRDLDGRLTRQTFPDLRELLATYDNSGNVSSLTPPSRPAHGFGYSLRDQQTTYTPPAVTGAGATGYAFNADRQLTTVTRPDAATVTPSYHPTTGRLTSLTHAHGTITPGYHATTGQVISLAVTGGTLAFTWDGFLPLSETWSGTVAGSVSRVFASDLRLASESVNGGSTAAYAFDADGLLTNAGALSVTRNPSNGLLEGTSLDHVTTERSHNLFAEPVLDRAKHGATTLYETTYTRDKLGRITAKAETVLGESHTWDFVYDLAGRLDTVTKDGVQVSDFGYDGNGNRLSHATPGGTTSATYDAQDRLLTYGGASYAYTANGELASRTDGSGTTTYVYDALGNLRSATLPGGTSIAYVIDGRNRRVGKRVGGALVEGLLYRDQLEPVAELDGAGNVVSRFVYGSKAHVPDYMVKAGVTYRIVSDHLGSPRLVINAATGAIAQRMDFDEWGNVTLDTAPGFQPFGFAGGILDADTGLTRFGVRDYDPLIGRWTAKDPVRFGSRSTNFFAYVDSDPLNYIDPDGKAKGGKKKISGDDPLLKPIQPGEDVDERLRLLKEKIDDPNTPKPRKKALEGALKTIKDGRFPGCKPKAGLFWFFDFQSDLDFYFDSPAFTLEEFFQESEDALKEAGPFLPIPGGALPNPAYDTKEPSIMDLGPRAGVPVRGNYEQATLRRLLLDVVDLPTSAFPANLGERRNARRKRRRYQRRRIKRLMQAQRFGEALVLLDRFLHKAPQHTEALCEKGHIFEFQSLAQPSRGRAERMALLRRSGRCYLKALHTARKHPLAEAAVLRDLADYWDAVGNRRRALQTVDRGLGLLATQRAGRSVLEWEEDLLRTKQIILGKTRPRVLVEIKARRSEIHRELVSRTRRRDS